MTAQEWLGVAGFVLSLVNAWQTWRRRPIVSLLPSGLQAEQSAKLLIEIQNRYNRPITLTRSRFWPRDEPHTITPVDGSSHAKDYQEINFLILPHTAARFFLICGRNKGTIRVAIFWESNAALAFAKFPLILFATESRQQKLTRAGS